MRAPRPSTSVLALVVAGVLVAGAPAATGATAPSPEALAGDLAAAATVTETAAEATGTAEGTVAGTAAATAALVPFGAPFAQTTYTGRIGDISGATVWSAAGTGDVTGDGRLDVVTSGLDGIVRVWSASGALQASADLGPFPIFGSPAIGDVDGDGLADVTVGNSNNTVATFAFRDSRASIVLWRNEPARVLPGPTGFFATPALADLDGDGRLDVVAASWGQTLEVFRSVPGVQEGQRLPGWPQWLLDTIWSSPAVGDVDGDGRSDVVVGGDCEGSGVPQPCYGTAGGGYVWAFNRDGSLKWKTFVPGQTIWSSPTLVDLTGDGAQDVVVGSGLFWPDPAGRAVRAFDGRTGAPLWVAAMPGRVAGSPSVADVDGDGRPEVFIVSEGGALLSFSSTGQFRWQQCIDSLARCPAGIGTFGGAALADVDGDGEIEAITQGEDKMRVFDARTGRLEQTVSGASPATSFAPAATPTVVQLDGRATVFQTAMTDLNRNYRRDAGDGLAVLAWRSPTALGAAPWPTFKGSSQRTGAVALPAIDAAATRRFVNALYVDLLGRQADPGGLEHWTTAIVSRRLTRYDVTLALASTDEWVGHVVTGYYTSTLGRQPDPVGLADWVGRIRRGTPVADVAASFYASEEYYRSTGGTPRAWVADLYRELLGREADPQGLDHWTRAVEQGTPRTTVAALFYSSEETVRGRVTDLYQHLLARDPDPAGLSTWPGFVRTYGDLSLAAALAQSPEYYTRAQRR